MGIWKRKPKLLKTTFWINRLTEFVSKNRVMQGPFKGMRIPPAEVGHTFMPRLLGTYEVEIAPIVSQLLSRNYERIVHVGAGDGYYAVGFALNCSPKVSVAFEANPEVASILALVSQINGVDSKITFRGHCAAIDLDRELEEEGSLLIIDVDGGEVELLDPEHIPNLRKSVILAELHPYDVPNIRAMMLDRFGSTHNIEEVPARKRTRSDLPSSLRGPQLVLCLAMREHRPMSQFWMLLEPKKES